MSIVKRLFFECKDINILCKAGKQKKLLLQFLVISRPLENKAVVSPSKNQESKALPLHQYKLIKDICRCVTLTYLFGSASSMYII